MCGKEQREGPEKQCLCKIMKSNILIIELLMVSKYLFPVSFSHMIPFWLYPTGMRPDQTRWSLFSAMMDINNLLLTLLRLLSTSCDSSSK